MKKEFSLSWKSSKKKRKQRKYVANAPIHIKRKFIVSSLAKGLRKTYKKRSLVLRKKDTVKIMRGSFKKKTGKVIGINVKKANVFVEGMQRTKKDGTKVNVPFDASNLQIIELNLDDKKRIKRKEQTN